MVTYGSELIVPTDFDFIAAVSIALLLGQSLGGKTWSRLSSGVYTGELDMLRVLTFLTWGEDL
jgi:hypothetical protein